MRDINLLAVAAIVLVILAMTAVVAAQLVGSGSTDLFFTGSILAVCSVSLSVLAVLENVL